MAYYKVTFSRRAEKELRSVSQTHDRKAIESALDELENNPRPPGCKKLKVEKINGGSESEITGLFIQSRTKFLL
jgi:mRNA-degrading endonuclease RelE of RelBE toxin-antitoxin system